MLLQLAACATLDAPGSHARLFLEKLNRYPQTADTLKIERLTGTSHTFLGNLPASPDVFIMVHPAYSLFFRSESRSKYPEAKYALLAKQFEDEERFISEVAKAGKIMILIIPGNYQEESGAPQSYTRYLNTAAGGGQTVFYLFSESAGNGSVSMNDMVDLYRFLQGIRVRKVLIGGGYIGRCQREFYNSLTAYFEKSSTYLVPEVSTISPDDITEAEARGILESIRQQNYSPVAKFIEKKLDTANLLSIPQKKER